ncbi:MAG: hypothetical protein ACR2MS_12070 [Weeksellaceae bacterium]
MFSLCMHAQIDWQNPNFREKTIAVQDTVVLDSLQILPEKFKIYDLSGKEISNQFYKIEGNLIYLSSSIRDSIKVSYYVHPDFKTIVTYPLDPSLIVPSASETNALVLGKEGKDDADLLEGLNSKGTLVRGLMFGNQQGSSVQSSFNLQLNGNLSDKVGIRATISDTNAPLEVDGYTQSLDQFERIFIEMFTDNSKVVAGHIDLENQNYFGRFQRKVTGLLASHTIKGEESQTTISASGSLSRGEYASYNFTGNEGNQGPYRLIGNQNEAYILIIAGSERVYRNGILLVQGEQKDYIIDYITGEITFTNQHLVTSTDRFLVEYQYTNRNYNRFTWSAGVSHTAKRWRISGHMYTESDNKDNPINQNLSADDKALLANAGSSTSNLYADSGVITTYQEDKVLYKKVNLNGVWIYEYSTDSQEDLYQVNFTYLGENQGDYILSNQGVNGRLFQYVAPIQGVSQGNYAPVRPLVAPTRKQIMSVSSAYDLKNNGAILIDLGLSNNDYNLFSDIDDDNNLGVGARVSTHQNFKWGKALITPEFSYEFVQDQFKPIERLRTPEFARDFNLKQSAEPTDQHFLRSDVAVSFNDSMRLNYGFDYLNQRNLYQGNRHRLGGELNVKGYKVHGKASYLNTKQKTSSSDFAQYELIGAKKIKKVDLEVGWLGEYNNHHAHTLDSLGFQWNSLYAKATLGDSLQRYLQLKAYRRIDDSTVLGHYNQNIRSWGTQFKSRLIQNTKHSLEALIDYRHVDYRLENESPSFINASILYRRNFLNQGLIFNMNYGLEGKTEQQRAFVYAKVTDGLGIYKWVDFNGDGIQQIDEFEVAEFSDEANYIRVYTNVVQSIRTNQNRLELNLNLYPSKFLEASFWERLQSRVIYNKRGNYLKENRIAVWNPFKAYEDLRGEHRYWFIQNDWNRGKNYQWHFNHQYKNQKNVHLIFTGLEEINDVENLFDLQYDIGDIWAFSIKQTTQHVISNSTAFVSRNYEIKGQEWSPNITARWGRQTHASLAYVYRDFNNISGIETLKASELNFILNWQHLKQTQVLANLNWISNDFTGNQDNLVANRLMKGLKKGQNWVWNLNVSRNINSFITLDIQYNGRKNENLKAIHTGNIFVRINF